MEKRKISDCLATWRGSLASSCSSFRSHRWVASGRAIFRDSHQLVAIVMENCLIISKRFKFISLTRSNSSGRSGARTRRRNRWSTPFSPRRTVRPNFGWSERFRIWRTSRTLSTVRSRRRWTQGTNACCGSFRTDTIRYDSWSSSRSSTAKRYSAFSPAVRQYNRPQFAPSLVVVGQL